MPAFSQINSDSINLSEKINNKINRFDESADSLKLEILDSYDSIQIQLNKVERKINQTSEAISEIDDYKLKLEFGKNNRTIPFNGSFDKIEPIDIQTELRIFTGQHDNLDITGKFQSKTMSPSWQQYQDKIQMAIDRTNIVKPFITQGIDPLGTAEGKLSQLDELRELQKANREMETIKSNYTELKTAGEKYQNAKYLKRESLKKELNNATEKMANSKEIKDLQKQISVHKRKFDKLKSINDIPKFAPNRLKDTPTKERLLLGMDLLIRNGNNSINNIFIGPKIGYKISGRLSAGISGFYKFSYTHDPFSVNKSDPSYGFRIFSNINITNNYYLYWESSTPEEMPDTRFEKFSKIKFITSLGVGKNYSIGHKIEGFSQVLYSFNNSETHYTNSLRKNINLRFGFYYLLKKSPRQKFLDRIKEKGLIPKVSISK